MFSEGHSFAPSPNPSLHSSTPSHVRIYTPPTVHARTQFSLVARIAKRSVDNPSRAPVQPSGPVRHSGLPHAPSESQNLHGIPLR